ncbi:MAG: bifunctional oligoribonuclease/PAP phosphatase NrnA [Lachnospiraceae bacterium]|nr:bifunctional oligoribonuclease/PAP phosphatase NrnA [Ruminococcus sp.]MCM1275328.1 bifunctional oligoribonuclease/PAP phosphatase NrnA [Lachnospiraceae bacterium]
MRIDVKQAAEFLRERDDFLILMHGNPDGDTLGCGCALCGALQRMGKRAKAVCPDEIPRRFDYLFKAVIEQRVFEPKTVVCVDVADTKLLGDMKGLGDGAELCIDHHLSNTGYAKRTLVRPEYAAACELVYEVIKELGVPFDGELANCIYTGTATDTGCFKFSNTTAQTHIIAAEMIGCGAEFAMINYVNFDLKTQGRIRLEQEVMKNIRYFANGHIAMITVPLSLQESIPDIDSDDVGALSNIPRQIEGVDIGICVKEKKSGVYKASMRSSERVNVAEICAEFGGGGHERAAGCSFYGGTIEEAGSNVVRACCKALERAGIE